MPGSRGLKDGRTHLAHKAEHAVDLASGAVLAVTIQAASEGDTATIETTLAEAQSAAQEINERGIEEVVADKGYHSGEVLIKLDQQDIRSYIPEPERGKRKWKGKKVEQNRVYANRRRVRGARSKRLQKKRSELTERSFAHLYETGAMRRVHLRGRDNILKRVLIHAAGFNLALIMRTVLGTGKPRQMKAGLAAPFFVLRHIQTAIYRLASCFAGHSSRDVTPFSGVTPNVKRSLWAMPPGRLLTALTTATAC